MFATVTPIDHPRKKLNVSPFGAEFQSQTFQITSVRLFRWNGTRLSLNKNSLQYRTFHRTERRSHGNAPSLILCHEHPAKSENKMREIIAPDKSIDTMSSVARQNSCCGAVKQLRVSSTSQLNSCQRLWPNWTQLHCFKSSLDVWKVVGLGSRESKIKQLIHHKTLVTTKTCDTKSEINKT